MGAIPINNKLSVLPAILAQNEATILAEWIKEMSGALRRSDLIKEDDLRVQCSVFLRQMRQGLETGATDFSRRPGMTFETYFRTFRAAALSRVSRHQRLRRLFSRPSVRFLPSFAKHAETPSPSHPRPGPSPGSARCHGTVHDRGPSKVSRRNYPAPARRTAGIVHARA